MRRQCIRPLIPKWGLLCRLLLTVAVIKVACGFTNAGAEVSAVRKRSPELNQTEYCSKGWTPVGRACYILTDAAKRNETQEMCRSMNGSLTEISDVNDQEELKEFLDSQGLIAFITWIGLSDQKKNRVWKWDSGSVLTYQKWVAGEPNNAGGKEFCVNTQQIEDYDWNDSDCRLIYPGVCKQPKGTGPLFPNIVASTLRSRTTYAADPLEYCSNGWTSIGTSCYQLTDAAARNAVQEKCRSVNGSLAEINNSEDQEELKDFLGTQGLIAFITWIGLTDPKKNRVWKWDSGTKLTYRKWVFGEPNNAGGKEFCVNTQQIDDYDWNDADCRLRYPGVCKQPKARWSTMEQFLSTAPSLTNAVQPTNHGNRKRYTTSDPRVSIGSRSSFNNSAQSTTQESGDTANSFNNSGQTQTMGSEATLAIATSLALTALLVSRKYLTQTSA